MNQTGRNLQTPRPSMNVGGTLGPAVAEIGQAMAVVRAVRRPPTVLTRRDR